MHQAWTNSRHAPVGRKHALVSFEIKDRECGVALKVRSFDEAKAAAGENSSAAGPSAFVSALRMFV